MPHIVSVWGGGCLESSFLFITTINEKGKKIFPCKSFSQRLSIDKKVYNFTNARKITKVVVKHNN